MNLLNVLGDYNVIASTLRQVNLTMNQYLGSISPPTDPDLCDARLVAMSLALDNLVLVTSSILTGCQWLQVRLGCFKLN